MERDAIDAFVERAAQESAESNRDQQRLFSFIFAQLFEVPGTSAGCRTIQLKFMSYVRTSRAAIAHLRAAGGGRIINVAGNGGRQPIPYHLPGEGRRTRRS